MSQSEPRRAPSTVPSALPRERLRFEGLRTRRTPGNRYTVEVELGWEDGMTVCGTASGQSSELADLRIAAEAALRAIELFSRQAFAFDLIGVKTVRGFDATVVMVAVGIKHGEGPRRLLGAVLAEDDTTRGAVLATLNATNRVLGTYIASR